MSFLAVIKTDFLPPQVVIATTETILDLLGEDFVCFPCLDMNGVYLCMEHEEDSRMVIYVKIKDNKMTSLTTQEIKEILSRYSISLGF